MLCYNAPRVVKGFRKRSEMNSTVAQFEAIKQESERNLGTRAGERLVVDQKKNQRGFTLVELITVMVIVGIMAVSVLPRFFTVSDFEDRGSADQVKSMLRFAQKTAIAQHRNISVSISSATTPNCTTTLAGASLTCQVKSSAPTITIAFDALGRPDTPGNILVGGATITVEQETGYVH